MSGLVPKYAIVEAINVAIATAVRALEEVRALARTPAPPSKLPQLRLWSSDAIHYEGDVVCHNGSTYQAGRDTAKEPPHGDWVCLASAGREGNGFSLRGTWEAAGEYNYLDVVQLNGASFAARKDSPGPCPGDGWQMIATQGKTGRPGDRGQQGPRGVPGAVISHVDVSDQGMLTLSLSDGSRIECDLYPVLSRIA